MPNSSGSNGLKMARVVGGRDGGVRIAGLRLDEGQRVVTEREVRAQLDRLLQLDERLVLAAAQPQRPAHGPMRGRVAIVDHEALPGGLEGPLDLRLALRPALEGVLEVREGQARIGAREGRIEAHRGLEEMLRPLVVGAVEPVHVPQAAMMRLPGVQRVRRLQDGAVALDRLDLAGDRGDDPVADLVEHEERIVALLVEDFRPDDAGGARLGELDRHGEALAATLHRSADDVVDVQHPAGLFRADAAARAARTRCPAR